MWRNIIGQAVYQTIVCLLLLFLGEKVFEIEFDRRDRFYLPQDPFSPTHKVELYTIVFQTFVFMQFFNLVPSRKVTASVTTWSVFADLCCNWVFWSVWICAFGAQVLVVQFGYRYIRVMPLTWEQHAYCAVLGVIGLVWGLLFNLILPTSWFDGFKIDEADSDDEDEEESLIISWKKNHA